MSFSIYIDSDEVAFVANEGETILESAKNNNVNLRDGCVKGICRVCKMILVSGDIKYPQGSTICLTSDEIVENYILPCCALPQSDLVCSQDNSMSGKKYIKEGVLVISKEDKGSVCILRLKLSASSSFSARPGDYIEVEFGVNKYRKYSVANNPRRDGYVELHIRYREGGAFSKHLRNSIVLNDVLWIRGPYGETTFNLASKRALLLIATGTGLAPILSMLRSEHIDSNREILLYWGCRYSEDLYYMDTISSVIDKFARLEFVPILSRPAEGNWEGVVGYVQNCVLDEVNSLHSFDVYACGSPEMIQDAFNIFTKHLSLPASQFYSDAFY